MAEIMVTSTADSGSGSLRQAIADASDGDVILFDSDVFPVGQTTSILLSSRLYLTKSLAFYGGFTDGTGGYTSGASKRFYVYREIDGVKTKVYIDDDNPALDSETVLFENVCRIALDGQETVYHFGVTGSVGAATFSGIGFNNGHNSNGGSLSLSSSTNTIKDCAFNSCVSTGYAGAVYAYGATTDKHNVISDCSFFACSAANGGAFASSTTAESRLNICCFDSCTASSNGGGVCATNSSQNALNDCIFDGCSAASGGGVFSANTSQNTLNGCVIDGCNASATGGALYSNNNSINILTNCLISGCSAKNSGGGVYSNSTSVNTLNNCVFDGCGATSGGGVYSNSTSQNTLNDCIFDGCTATNHGGGLRSADTSQTTLNNCIFDSCSANYGGAIYSLSSSQNTLNACTITSCSATSGGGIYSTNTSVNTLNNSVVENAVYIGVTSILNASSTAFNAATIGSSAFLNINGGVTSFATLTLSSGATVTIEDGAALTITTSATIGAATFTSEGRGYLAVGAGINISSATLTGVVACSYGADVSSFAEVDGVLEWDAANPSTSVLIERADGDSWSTVTQTAGESLTLYLPPSDTVRLFDGVHFFTAQAPAQRTYYYIGSSEGSFTSAADWSLRRGGVAITEPPVVAGQRFIVGDIEDAQEE